MANNYKFEGPGLEEKQVERGQHLFEAYIRSYPHLNTLGNSNLLQELIWQELMLEMAKKNRAERMSIQIQAGSPIQKSKDLVSESLNQEIEMYLNQTIKLKEKLNLFDDPKTRDTFDQMQDLFKKAREYRETHIDEFLCTCPFCAEVFVLMRRTLDYEIVKTPFFEDKLLFNRPLMEIYHQNILTKDQTAKVLGTNPRYIDWLDTKFYGIKHSDGNQSAPTHIEESAPTHTDDNPVM